MMGAVPIFAATLLSATTQGSAKQEIREVARRYAACVVKSSSDAARRFIVGGSDRPPIIIDCLKPEATGGGAMRFPAATYRYALSEALLLRDYGSGIPEGAASAAPYTHDTPQPLDETKLPRGKRGEEVRERHRQAQGFYMIDVLAECAARKDPAGSLALVKAGLDDDTETAAFTALKPAIAKCLPPNETLKFNRSVLRGSLAYNLYRIAYAVRPKAGSRT